MYWFGVIVSAYLLASVPFSYLIARWWYGIDITATGSRNSGATNIARVVGKYWLFFLVVVLDAGRAYILLLLAEWYGVSGYLQTAVAIAILLGNCYSPFLLFRGGKGVSTSLGLIAYCVPTAAPLYVGLWMVCALLTRVVGLASPGAALLGGMVLWLCGYSPTQAILGLCIGMIVVWRHRENIDLWLRSI